MTKASKYSGLKILEVDISLTPRSKAPREAGIKRQKENLKASIVEKPNNKAIKIVEPARETPGKMAIA